MPISKVLHNELNTLRAENAALKEQVAQLQTEHADISLVSQLHYDQNLSLRQQLTTLQSKSAALVDALEKAVTIIDGAVYCGHELNANGNTMLSDILAALVAFKGEM